MSTLLKWMEVRVYIDAKRGRHNAYLFVSGMLRKLHRKTFGYISMDINPGDS